MLKTFTRYTCLVLSLILTFPAFAEAPGAVYAMTNASGNNEILIYDRAANGVLSFRDKVSTNGAGSGGSPPIEAVDALGAQAPLILSQNNRWLIAVNAGSDEISVFRVLDHSLILTDKVSSGGLFPASLTLHKRWLYVLNSGGDGNITGFTLGVNGHLTPIAGSTRSLNADGTNPPFFLVSPAQVGFDRSGDYLIVTVKGTNTILAYSVDEDGVPSDTPVSNSANGSTPFGFAFDRHNHLIVVEAFGRSPVGTGEAGAVSSYDINDDGTISVISASVRDFQTATCWITLTGNSRFAFATNNGSNTISGYHITASGDLNLLAADGVSASTGMNPVDIAITSNGLFAYTVNAGSGTISMFRIAPDSGSLTALGEIAGLPVNDGAVGIAAR